MSSVREKETVRTKVINGKVVKEKKAVRVVEEVTYEEVVEPPKPPKPVKARAKALVVSVSVPCCLWFWTSTRYSDRLPPTIVAVPGRAKQIAS